jgi:H+/Cl- antiporter ClcA
MHYPGQIMASRSSALDASRWIASGLKALRASLGGTLGIGLFGALLGLAYLAVLHVLEHAWGPGTTSDLGRVAILTAAGVCVGLLGRMLGSPGDVELLVDNIHVAGGRADLRRLRSLLPISLLCISSGGAAGPEAPLVTTSGSLAAWWGERARLTETRRRTLTIAGMATAFTVLFGAPLGGAIFALEILHRRGLEYYEALLPAVVSALVGYVVCIAATQLGLRPVWTFGDPGALKPVDLAWVAGAGVVGAGVSVVFMFAVRAARQVFSLVPELGRPALGGLVLGLLSLLSPFALTYGKHQVDLLSGLQVSGVVFALIAAAKLAGTSVTVASGWRGGCFIPLFFVGASLARAVHVWLPASNELVLTAALMAAVNTGVTKTPIGSTLVVAQMTGLSLVPTTALASVVALLLTSQVGLLESQRERKLAPETAASGKRAVEHAELAPPHSH